MGDRWNGDNLTDSRTVWLPIQMNTDNTVSVLGEQDWTLDRLDQLLPTTVNTELPTSSGPTVATCPRRSA